MSFLLRVMLPDVPGSLGRLATAIGEAGGDIEAIEIVEKASNGVAVDDVMLTLTGDTMPDAIVSACHDLPGVEVLWISRYAAGGQLFLDLEVVEAMTVHPESALERLVQLCPDAFRVEWAAVVDVEGIRIATQSAPTHIPYRPDHEATRVETGDNVVLCSMPVDESRALVLGRSGGPEFLDSELARLQHLARLAVSIGRAGRE